MKTQKQEAFIEAYCLTGNAAKAAEMAGYSQKAAKQKGYVLKHQFSDEIQEKSKQMIQDCVPGALAQLKNLSEEADSESVKLGAIKDILDRAGLKPTDRVEQQISHVEASSVDELKRELEDINSVPFPDRSLYQKYEERMDFSVLYMLTTRGCPYKCTFCFLPIVIPFKFFLSN